MEVVLVPVVVIILITLVVAFARRGREEAPRRERTGAAASDEPGSTHLGLEDRPAAPGAEAQAAPQPGDPTPGAAGSQGERPDARLPSEAAGNVEPGDRDDEPG